MFKWRAYLRLWQKILKPHTLWCSLLKGRNCRGWWCTSWGIRGTDMKVPVSFAGAGGFYNGYWLRFAYAVLVSYERGDEHSSTPAMLVSTLACHGIHSRSKVFSLTATKHHLRQSTSMGSKGFSMANPKTLALQLEDSPWDIPLSSPQSMPPVSPWGP